MCQEPAIDTPVNQVVISLHTQYLLNKYIEHLGLVSFSISLNNHIWKIIPVMYY